MLRNGRATHKSLSDTLLLMTDTTPEVLSGRLSQIINHYSSDH